MESPSYAAQFSQAQAKENLRQDNLSFMNLMLGSKGIRTIQSTPEECRQMIDGCLTVGITDRLYGFDSQSDALRVKADQLQDMRRAHALLAIEFYEVGYLNMHDNSNRNTPARFGALCGLAFPIGTIFEYKDRLEDVIKRTSQPLKFSDFGIVPAAVVAPPIAAPAPAEGVGPVERYYTDAELANQPAEAIAQYKQARDVAKRTAKAARMGCGLPAKFEGDVVVAEAAAAPIVAQVEAVVPQAQGEERYYTDAEIKSLATPHGNIYRKKMSEGMSPSDIRGFFSRAIQNNIEAKYAPAGAPPPVSVVAQASAGGLLASITAGKALNATAGDHPDQKPVAAAAPSPSGGNASLNSVADEMRRRLEAKKAAEKAKKIAAGEDPDDDDSGSEWD